MNPVAQAASELSSRGFVVLVVVVFGILFAASFADLWLAVLRPLLKRLGGQEPNSTAGQGTGSELPFPLALGDYVSAFVKTRPWVAVVLALVFGAMITHFFIYIENK